MKRSDIRNAYDQMNPTRDQKDRMLCALLKEEKFSTEKTTGKYKSAPTKTHRWSWVPAVAALILVMVAGVFVLGRTDQTPPVLSADRTSIDAFAEIPQLRIGKEWYQYLQTYAGTGEHALMYPYSVWGCRNQEMAAKLDELCKNNVLTFRDQEERMTDSLSLLMEEVGIDSLLDENAGHQTGSCAWWDDGQFYLSGDITLKDSDWTEPIRYVLHRTYDSVFLHPYVDAASNTSLDCWEYTDDAGVKLILALGDRVSFIFADLETDIIFVEVNHALHGFAVNDGPAMDREDLEAFANTFTFALTESVNYEDAYASVLNTYRTALEEGWSAERCIQANISFRFGSTEYAEANAGYCLVDLDGNGVEELIVGHAPAGDLNIWDIHTVDADGTVQSIITTTDYGMNVTLNDGNVICTDSSTKDQGDIGFYTWDAASGFHILDAVTSDGNTYYDEVNQRTITAKEALAITMDKYEMISPELTWLMDVPDYLREGSESMEVYTLTLEKYRTALAEKWTAAQCAEEGISILVAYFTANPDQLGYTMLDLDGDTKDELIITDGNVILDMYTLYAGTVTQIFTGWERNSYYLTDGLGIFNQGSNGAANTVYNYYRYHNGILELEEAVIFDASEDPDAPWFHQTGDKTVSISEALAQEIMQYRCTVEIDFTSFANDPVICVYPTE